MSVVLLVIAFLFGPAFVIEAWSDEVLGTRSLRLGKLNDVRSIIPSETRLLNNPREIEQFLDELDGTPPDWATVYGHGHHDPGHDDRLFALNRERDARRAGNPALTALITFMWIGDLSRYDAEAGGFRVALGPKFTPTRWGVVRFKFEDLPGNLVAKASATLRSELERQLARGEAIDIAVAMTGRLIPDESLVYDFSHDQEGLGLIMPVVRLEQIDFLLIRD